MERRHDERAARLARERLNPAPATGKFRAVRGKANVKAAKRARQKARRNDERKVI